jgi:ribonucleotide reductase beta subunit family protein with ferritin-like domain
MSYYAQTYTSEKAEQERQKAQRITDMFKALELAQATITVQLQIIVRNGKSKATLDRLKEAETAYAEAYAAILDSAPTAQAAISRRGR